MNFSDLTPTQKKWAIRLGIGVVICVLAIPLYNSRQDTRAFQKESERIVDIDKHTFEDSILAQTQGEIKELRNSIDAFKDEYLKKLDKISSDSEKQLKDYKKSIEKTAQKAINSRQQKAKEEIIQEVIEKTGGTIGKKRPTNQAGIFNEGSPGAGRPGEKMSARKPAFGISVSRPENLNKKKKKDEAKENKKTVYLPPGFTEASLLSGAIAPTSENSGDGHVPMIIRIKDLAVLPNEYKQDLKGCFVIANGEGNLAQERISTRLATLSCISKDGKSIIDQPVKGWVVDKDGRAGMRGKVIAKFGAHVARMAFAGTLKGFGEVFSETSYVTYSGPSGSSRQLKDTNLDTLAQAGVGGSLSTVADDLEEFYLNLAEQTLPVIEVGPTKNITLVFSEGVELEIKDRI